MPSSYIVKNLLPDQFPQAYPLIQMTGPAIHFNDWMRHADFLTKDRPLDQAGVVSLQNAAGYIHGLFLYSVDQCLCCGRVFEVGPVIAPEIVDRAIGVRLIEAIVAHAHARSCDAIHVNLPPFPEAAAPIAAALREAGFTIEAVRFGKALRDTGDLGCSKRVSPNRTL